MKAVSPLAKSALVSAFLTLGVSGLSAAVITWTGAAGDGLYVTAGNWTGAATPPRNQDWQDTALFTGTPVTVTVPADRLIHTVQFDNAGWTLSGGPFGELTKIISNGAGVNTMVSLELHAAGQTWITGEGNTLRFTNGYYQKGFNLNIDGGGTLELGAQITGFGGTVGNYGLYIKDAHVKFINSSSPFSGASAGVIYIDSLDASLQLKTTVAAAQLLIGNRVRDGVGSGLLVTQMDDDYVLITAIPEPGAAALLGLAALGAIARPMRRRQQ